jgi:peptidoglycan/LPS O-acetylase OafA/YrhL
LQQSSFLAKRLTGSHIPALDGVRGLAAVAVLMHHIGFGTGPLGAYGVAVFFVLSGFLITWLLLKENSRTGDVSLRNFYIRRTLRIFPAFYVYWAITVLGFYWMRGSISWPEPIAAFLYCGDWFHGLQREPDTNRIMVITWSLGVEEKFYLIWPWLFLFFRKNLRGLIRVTLALIGIIWLYRLGMMAAFDLPKNYLKYAFEARFDNILWGCLLALLTAADRLPGILRKLASQPALVFPVAGGIVVSLGLEARFGSQYHYSLGMTVDAILTVILLVQLICWTSSPLWSWLESPPARFLGRISYSLYLYHLTVIPLVKYLGVSRYSVRLLCFVLGSVLVATASYYLVEKPFLRLKDRFTARAERQVVAGSEA